jgi:hypothetical protein
MRGAVADPALDPTAAPGSRSERERGRTGSN